MSLDSSITDDLQREREIDNEFIAELRIPPRTLSKLAHLIKQGADINSISKKTRFNCLMDALYTIPRETNNFTADQKLILFLLDNGANMNYCNHEGFGPLHCTVWGFLNIKMLELLLKRGAFPNYLFLYEGTVLDIQSYYLFGGKYKKNEDAALRFLKNSGARYSVDLKTTQISNYLSFQLTTDSNYCFSSLTGFLSHEHIKGISAREFSELLKEYELLIQIKAVKIGSEDYLRVMSFNQKLLNLAIQIKRQLPLGVAVYLTLFDISYKGSLFFGNNLSVYYDSCLPTLTCESTYKVSDNEPF